MKEHQGARTSIDHQVRDAAACVDYLISAAVRAHLDEHVIRSMPSMWAKGIRYVNSASTADQMVGYSLLLTAIIHTPGAPQKLCEVLREMLQGRV